MNKLLTFLIAGLLIGATTLAAPLRPAQAQSALEPAVVISISSVKDQIATVNYLVEAAGFEQMKFMAQTMVKQYTKGMDNEKAAGVLLFFNEGSETPDFLGFVPVSNLDDLLDTVSGMAEVDEGDEFITIITDDETELLVKEVNNYAFISNKEEMFENLPDDPNALLGGMPEKYNLAASVFGQRIPAEMRQQALDMIRDGYEQQLDQLAEAEPMQAELQRKNFDFQMKQFESWINETENLSVGMTADKEAESLYMDVKIQAAADSELATRMNASVPPADQKSKFSGFQLEGAAFTGNTHVMLHPDESTEYSKMLDQVQESAMEALETESELDDSELEAAEKALASFIEIGKETLENGVLDSGIVVMLGKKEINFAGGSRVASPQKLEETLKDLAKFAEEKMGDEIEINLNSGSHKDVTFHQIVVDVPEDEEEMSNVLGDQITILIGIGKDSVYVGAGTNPMPLLKKAMDNENTSDPKLMRYDLYLAPILRFASGIEGEPALEAMATELENNGKHRMGMVSNPIENGVTMRFDMQDGILALIKVGFESMGGGGGFNDNDF